MISLDKKIPDSLVSKAKGLISPEQLAEEYKREQAALAMCGALLGNCYLLAEIAETLMNNTISKCKKHKWFKHEIKNGMNRANKELHNTIFNSIHNSPTNTDYMREVSDALYDILKPDIFKLQNAILFELNKRKINDANIISEILVIDVLLRSIGLEYNDIIEYMNTIYRAFYDTWYFPAKCEGPTKLWSKSMNMFFNNHINNDIDLNNIDTIKNGISIIQKKMHSKEVSEAAQMEAKKYASEGNGKQLYYESLKVLNLN